MRYEQSLEYIYQTEWKGSILGLSRMENLMGALDHPERKTKVIHIAGTNGKGSTARMLAEILTQAGYKTGLYISPSIRTFEERMQIDGVPISKDALIESVETLKAAADPMEDAPTEYERITATAFIYFAKEHCDFAIIETGLGGRLDATNVVSPVLSIITAIGLDHVQELGDTLEKIAAEKAGIIKQNTPVVVLEQQQSEMDVLKAQADSVQAPFYLATRGPAHPVSFTEHGQHFTYGSRENYALGLFGLFQLQNVGTVLTAIDVLKETYSIPEEAVKSGLENVKWMGRFEILSHDPFVIIDAAHNPQGAESLASNLNYYFPKKKFTAVFGVLADKGYNRIVDEMHPRIDKWIAVTPNSTRALPAEQLAKVIKQHGGDVSVAPSVAEAIEMALAQETDGLCIFGSLTLLDAVYSYFENEIHLARVENTR